MSNNIGKMLKQAQTMQAQMKKVQDSLAVMERSFVAGGGAVAATARGDYTITRIKIDPAVIDPQDAEGLEDLVLTAINGALEEIRREAEQGISKVTGGMKIPGLF